MASAPDLVRVLAAEACANGLQERLEWKQHGAQRRRGDAVAKLKKQPGEEILIHRSAALVNTLLPRSLIDAVHDRPTRREGLRSRPGRRRRVALLDQRIEPGCGIRNETPLQVFFAPSLTRLTQKRYSDAGPNDWVPPIQSALCGRGCLRRR
jgi:hypothetical protein